MADVYNWYGDEGWNDEYERRFGSSYNSDKIHYYGGNNPYLIKPTPAVPKVDVGDTVSWTKKMTGKVITTGNASIQVEDNYGKKYIIPLTQPTLNVTKKAEKKKWKVGDVINPADDSTSRYALLSPSRRDEVKSYEPLPPRSTLSRTDGLLAVVEADGDILITNVPEHLKRHTYRYGSLAAAVQAFGAKEWTVSYIGREKA